MSNSRPINPWHVQVNFNFDVEATHLYFRHFFSTRYDDQGKFIFDSMADVMDAYKHSELLQFGYRKDSHKRPVHIELEDVFSHSMPEAVSPIKVVPTILAGHKAELYQHSIQGFSGNDIRKHLTKSGKLSARQVDTYMQEVAPRFVSNSIKNSHIIPLMNGKALSISDWSYKQFLEPSYEDLQSQMAKYFLRTKEMTMSDFYGRGQDSLFSIVDDLLKGATVKRPKVIGLWNAPFDINFIRFILERSGNVDLRQRFEAAAASGSLQIHSAEREWQAIAYKLMKDNPQFKENFVINFNPAAYAETGGRSGQTANTLNEFRHALTWKEDRVARYLSWHKAVNEALAGAGEAHIAGADVRLTDAIMQAFNDIKHEIFTITSSQGKHFANLEAFATSMGNEGIIEQAITEAMRKHAVNLGGADAAHMVGAFKEGIAKDAKAAADFTRKMYPSFMASKATSRASGMLKKHGGLGLAIAALGYMTYGGQGETDYDLSDAGLSLGKRKVGSLYTSNLEGKASKDPYVKSQIFTKLLPGAGLTFAGIYGTGLLTAYRKGMLPSALRRPTSVFDMARQAMRTAYIGAKQVESMEPLTRVFRTTAMHDYFFGSSGKTRTGEFTSKTGEKFERQFAISIFENGAEVKDWQKAHNITELIEAAHITNPDVAAEISEKLALKDAHKSLLNRQIRITSLPGRGTRIYFEDDIIVDPTKKTVNKVGSLSYMVDLETQVVKKSQNTFKARERAQEGFKARTQIENPIIMNKASHNLASRPEYAKIPFNSYIDTQVIRPSWAHGGGSPEKLWKAFEWMKWKLDIIPKGIGQGRYLARPELGRSINLMEDYVTVKWFTKNKWSKDSLKYMGDYMRHPVEEMTMHAMNRFLETPFETVFGDRNLIRNWAGKLSAKPSRAARIAGAGLRILERPHLGLDVSGMRYGLPQYLLEFGLKRILPAAALMQGMSLLDHALGTMSASPTGRGPITTLPIKAYEAAQLTYAKISDWTGLTEVAKKQNQYAPGSTGIGIFAFPMTMLGAYKVSSFLYKHGPSGIGDSIRRVGERIAETQFAKTAMQTELWRGAVQKSPMQRLFGWAVKNPAMAILAAGLAPMLPFLPGFIGSDKSYDELRDTYKGEKEVAVRKYRGWLMSPSPYMGGKPVQFRKHFLASVESDWENRGVVWPSFWKRAAHNLTLGLYGRYMLEDYHKDSQPVYTSAPYGASIPLIGPLIAATAGRIIKPTIQYHQPTEGLDIDTSGGSNAVSGAVGNYTGSSTPVIEGLGLKIQSQGSAGLIGHDFVASFEEFSGFRGFMFRTMRQYAMGMNSADQYVPYAQSAKQFYNPANQMWQYQMGDISVVGGEFFRRLLQQGEKKWEINTIKNELFGTNWIPHREQYKDYWHGTTFDKTPMGWLYGSRKGWEFLYPEVRGKALNDYPEEIRTEILKQIAPSSKEFNVAAEQTLGLALSNKLSPRSEQRYYETLNQVRQLRQQIYAHAANYAYRLDTDSADGYVTGLDEESGEFTVDSFGDRRFRLAGVSLNEEDIRARLLQKREYDSAQELDQDAQQIHERMLNAVREHMAIGAKISFDMPEAGQFSGYGKPTEAIVGGLNEDLLDMGSPFTNTGNLAMHNIAQDQAGTFSRGMAKYWDTLTSPNTFWNKKLISDRDYMQQYLASQYFNKEVKLWSKPLEHIVEPMIASALSHIGIEMQPSFTKERREQQQYWDIVKYMKYKMLASQAHDSEEASYYHSMWRSTMIGADPTDNNVHDEKKALPLNERAYFDFFASEPDPSKRAKIYKYLPTPAKRLYKAIWTRQLAESSDDQEVLDGWARLQESEGWDLSEEDEETYLEQTEGSVSKGDWARASFISQYLEDHPTPGPEWSGWSPDVDIENVELLSLRDQGQQIQDYGYFDSKARMAAFDGSAAQASIELNSTQGMSPDAIGTMMDLMSQDDAVYDAVAMPTTARMQTLNTEIETDGYDKSIRKAGDKYLSILDDRFL